MSSELDAWNADWERNLNPWQAAIWKNMKAVGARAYWRDPLNDRAVRFTEMVGSTEQQRSKDEVYEFVVEYQGTVLIRSTKHKKSLQATELGAITIAANRLENMDIQVMPR